MFKPKMTLRFSTATLEAEIAAIERKLRELTVRERYPDFDKLPKMNSDERRKFKRALQREWQRRKKPLEQRRVDVKMELEKRELRERQKWWRGRIVPGHYGANQ